MGIFKGVCVGCVKCDLCVRMAAPLSITVHNKRSSSDSRDTGTETTVNVCRRPRVGRSEQPWFEPSAADQWRQPSRSQRRRQQRRQRLAIITGQAPWGQVAPGVYSLPVRIDRDTLREPITIGFCVVDGFVNIFEVPSGDYHRAMATVTRVQGRRPAGLSDEEDENGPTCCEPAVQRIHVCGVVRVWKSVVLCVTFILNRFPDLS